MSLSIKQESLSATELRSHFELSKDDFVPRNSQFISDYIEKLVANARFITLRDDGLLCGMTAFYANNLPNAYISRVWLLKCYRGGCNCDKMLEYVAECCINLGFHRILLEVRRDNIIAQKAYLRNGFKTKVILEETLLMQKNLI